MTNFITGRVCKNGKNGQRIVTIPRREEKFQEGEYVMIKYVEG